MKRLLAALALAVALVAVGCGSSSSPEAGATPTTPASSATATSSPGPTQTPADGMVAVAAGWEPIAASDFVTEIDNPWFPLMKGRSWVSVGVKDGQKTVDTYTVTGQTKVIMGVTCSVIRDRLTVHNKAVEATWDWYAQDKQGNVWYMGEDTAELNAAGNVTSTSGSWETGVDGAAAGIFMPADPQVGMGGYQEYYEGEALDQYKVISMTAAITVPYGAFEGCLETRETTALEPSVVDHKYYVKGIGQVAEESVKGPREASHLTKLTK